MKNNLNIRFEHNTVSAEKLIEMYIEIGWGNRENYRNLNEIPFNASCQYFSLFLENELIGFSKVLTDCYSFSILVEVVIKPLYQRQGFGTILLEYTESQIPTKHLFVHSLSGNQDFFLQRNFKESSYYHLFLKKLS